MELEMKVLHKDLEKFQSISLLLQKDDGLISLLDVRVMFDSLIRDYGDDFRKYLAPEAVIVNNPEFENAIVKYLKDEFSLMDEDRHELKFFDKQPK